MKLKLTSNAPRKAVFPTTGSLKNLKPGLENSNFFCALKKLKNFKHLINFSKFVF